MKKLTLNLLEDIEEVKITKEQRAKINKRAGIPPNAPEINKFSNLYTAQSYDNAGNPQPFGVDGVASVDGGQCEGVNMKLHLNLMESQDSSTVSIIADDISSEAEEIQQYCRDLIRHKDDLEGIGRIAEEIKYCAKAILTKVDNLDY